MNRGNGKFFILRGLFRAMLIVSLACSVAKGEVDPVFRGEATGWATLSETGEATGREAGVRYLPTLELFSELGSVWSWDAELSLNLYGVYQQMGETQAETEADIKPHRLWGRLYTQQFGARLGMQEISFGPGKLLRSLRWFDQKDSRDLTGFTEGVKGLLCRYYFENNANIWAWSLYGNDDPMGISVLTTTKDSFEGGGRVQVPLGRAEAGVSLHRRTVDTVAISGSGTQVGGTTRESRMGLDLAANLNVGLYAEGTLLRLEEGGLIPEEQVFWTVGGDYTFDFGNGLMTQLEMMNISARSDSGAMDDVSSRLWAASAQYGLNLLDSLQLMTFRPDETGISLWQGVWKRTTDRFVLNLILIQSDCPPGAAANLPASLPGGTAFCRDAVQLLVQYNH